MQFYEEEAFLCDTVAYFCAEGLAAGERALLIAEPEHVRGILAALGQERAAAAQSSGQLTILDAQQLLSSFLVDGMPDAERFHAAVRGVLQRARGGAAAAPGVRLRAFGEMVNLLWRAGNTRAALRLEELWNEAGQAHEFSLLCAYGIRHFTQQRDGLRFDQACHLHTCVIPAEGFSRLSDADERLREIGMLQQSSRALEQELQRRQALEGALREVLESRARVEADLSASLEREQAARARAQASDAFKEAFVGALGRELRRPLDVMVTTARLLTLRGELTADGQKQLDRMVSNGLRMQRMLEQVLDLARERWTTGISVSRTPDRDLRALVGKIVEETRLAHPRQRIELLAERSCLASVDADRFEQVVAHLLSNATTHGDASRPIQVVLERKGGDVSLSVHNYGPPIAPELLPLLFELSLAPRRRAPEPGKRCAGLGLGLYISDRIVRAHGGTLRVESSAERGTRFEATFPQLDGSGVDRSGVDRSGVDRSGVGDA